MMFYFIFFDQISLFLKKKNVSIVESTMPVDCGVRIKRRTTNQKIYLMVNR